MRIKSGYVETGVFKKNHQCFRSNLSLCRHLEIISDLLLRDFFGSAWEINVFSSRHSWHDRTFLLYEGAKPAMDQALVC